MIDWVAVATYRNNAKVHFDARLVQGTRFDRRLAYDGLENLLCLATINAGGYCNPTCAGDTLSARVGLARFTGFTLKQVHHPATPLATAESEKFTTSVGRDARRCAVHRKG